MRHRCEHLTELLITTYSFFSFSYRVSLRKNGKILVTAMSEESGFSPVSQATLTYLKPGDKVQLEVIQGRLYESPIADMAYTTFSGSLP